MPMMKSHYTHQIISTTGHSVEFEADVPLWVPENDFLVGECLKLGAVLCDNEDRAEPAPEPVESRTEPAAPAEKSDNANDAEAEFLVGLDHALLKILTRNDPTDLKADLTPKVLRVVAEMSPDLRRPSATEVSDAYQRLQENIDLAE